MFIFSPTVTVIVSTGPGEVSFKLFYSGNITPEPYHIFKTVHFMQSNLQPGMVE